MVATCSGWAFSAAAAAASSCSISSELSIQDASTVTCALDQQEPAWIAVSKNHLHSPLVLFEILLEQVGSFEVGWTALISDDHDSHSTAPA